MAKRYFDDVICLQPDDSQPLSKQHVPESTISTAPDVRTPPPNGQSLVKVNPMLAGLLEQKPIDKNRFFDNVLNYFDPSASNHGNVDEKKSVDEPKIAVPVDDGSPKMILNPKALMRQKLMQNSSDIVPNSAQKKSGSSEMVEAKKKRKEMIPPSLNPDCCVIDKLVRRYWSSPRSASWKEADVIQFYRTGRPTPELPTLGVNVNLYDHHTWVTGCPGMGGLFCWPCLLFTSNKSRIQNSTWVKEGFTAMKLLGTSMTKHELSNGHKESMTTMSRLTVYLTNPALNGPNTKNDTYDGSTNVFSNSFGKNVNPNSNAPIIQMDLNVHNPSPVKPGPASQNQVHINDQHKPETCDFTPADEERDSLQIAPRELGQKYLTLSVEHSITKLDYIRLMEELQNKDITPSSDLVPVVPPSPPKSDEIHDTEVRVIQLLYCQNGVFRGDEEVKEKLVAAGRPKPEMPRLIQVVDGTVTSFSCSYYDTYPWLCGSAELNRLYCWPCLLFNRWHNTSIWNTSGFDLMANLKAAATAHAISHAHFENSLHMKIYEQMRKGKALHETERAKHNEVVRQKKSILKYLIDAVYFKKTHQNTNTPEDYNEFFQILSSYNLELKVQLDSSSANFLKEFTPNVIAEYSRETAKAMKIFLKRKIAKEVDDSAYVSFILKTVKYNRVALILRYSKFTGEVVERFFKFIKISFGLPDALLKKILEQVDWLKCADKFVGISYDGGVLHPDQMESFNSKLRQSLMAGYFFNCKQDNFKLLLQQSLSCSRYCRSFFHVLEEFREFLRGDSRVFSLMKKIAHVQDDWDSGIIVIVRNHYSEIMAVLDQIVNRVLVPAAWSNQVVAQCAKFSMFLGMMETRLLLVVVSKVFLLLHPLIEAFQGEFDAKYWKNAAQDAYSAIFKVQSCDFFKIYLTAKNLGPTDKGLNNREGHNKFLTMYNETFDWILSFIRARTKYVDVWEYFDASTTKIDTPVSRASKNHAKFQIELKECFPFFDNVKLSAALIFAHCHEKFKRKSALDILKISIKWDFKAAMPEFVGFLLVVNTVPSSAAHVSDPPSDRIVSYVKGKTELKSADAIIHVEKSLLASARNENNFYDDVIRIIAELKGTDDFTEICP